MVTMAKYKWIHDCQKPEMSKEVNKITYRRFLWFKREKITTETIWERRQVKWTCPECKTSWDWLSTLSNYGGSWFCNSRPEVWKEYKGIKDEI